MGLKQIEEIDRIVFLKKFTAELIAGLAVRHMTKQRIEIEKLRKKFVEPIFEDERKPIIHRIKIVPTRKIKMPIIKRRPQLMESIQVTAKPPKTQHLSQQISPQIQALTSVQPQAQPRPTGFNLGEIENLLKDPSIQSIECPGPGKNMIVKRYGKVNITKIVLNQADIKNIINSFSEQARIPVVGGILKAAVGDLVISAVVSEFVGSRFIINKVTPYSLIEGK